MSEIMVEHQYDNIAHALGVIGVYRNIMRVCAKRTWYLVGPYRKQVTWIKLVQLVSALTNIPVAYRKAVCESSIKAM